MKLSILELLRIQDRLDVSLTFGNITLSTYNAEWSELLAASGWTDDEYAVELDRRWDYLQVEAARSRTANSAIMN